MHPELSQWIPPAVIVGFMLYLHRITSQDMGRLREEVKGVRGEVADLRQHVDQQNGDLRDRLGRIEGYLDVLRVFFVRNGRGAVA